MYGNESELAGRRDRDTERRLILVHWEIATLLMAGDIGVFHKIEVAHAVERA